MPSQQAAVNKARRLLEKSLPGKKASVKKHMERAQRITEVIWQYWEKAPYQWQVKHLRWYLDSTEGMAPSTRYDHWRTIKALIASLGKYEDWLPLLRGPWVRQDGQGSAVSKTGRPPKLPGGRKKKAKSSDHIKR